MSENPDAELKYLVFHSMLTPVEQGLVDFSYFLSDKVAVPAGEGTTGGKFRPGSSPADEVEW
jgi:hypothetical protein